MYSKDLVQKVRKAYAKQKSYRKVAKAFLMVEYIVKNDYSRPKKKTGPKKRLNNRLKGRILLEVKRLAARSERITARKIHTNCNIDLSVRHLQHEPDTISVSDVIKDQRRTN
jgi:hypothetical protein